MGCSRPGAAAHKTATRNQLAHRERRSVDLSKIVLDASRKPGQTLFMPAATRTEKIAALAAHITAALVMFGGLVFTLVA